MFNLYFLFFYLHRGRIRLKSKNVEDHALIIPNYFHHPDDLIPIIESFKFGKKLAAAFEDGNALKSDHFPGCSEHETGNYLLFKLQFE